MGADNATLTGNRVLVAGKYGATTPGDARRAAHPNSSRKSCAIGTARASTIKRFLIRRCSSGSSGIDHPARLDSPMR